MSKHYVTTSIPYVNARPHIGFALELVQADVVARYHRMIGDETHFQTGADENAFKNVIAAREKGISTEEFVNHNSTVFAQLCEALNISADDFVRTTESRHIRAVHSFWARFDTGDVYRRPYAGLYCVGCEDFLTERDLVDGLCPDHDDPLVEIEEENYFFRLSKYQREIDRLISSNTIRVVPETRKNEVLSFVRQGLQDISISRNAERSGGWGISVPGDNSQVIYVWVDALVNYLSGLGLGTSKEWRDHWWYDATKTHVIGKNVWKFHAVYWPAFLLSARLPLPDEIVVHGFVTENGRKISKSQDNTIDPFACIEEFGIDALRYYLLKGIPPFADGDFSRERLIETYNTELANDLGNLVSRLTTLCAKASYGKHTENPIPEPPTGYRESISRYDYGSAIEALWGVVHGINQAIQHTEPCKLLKDGVTDNIRDLLTAWLHDLHTVGYWLSPLLPETSAKILEAIRQSPIKPNPALFPRIRE